MPIGILALVDFVFKKIFGTPGNELALIGMLNALLRLKHPIVKIAIENPFNYQDFIDDKLSILDLRATDSLG